jgi:hypothetical protein
VDFRLNYKRVECTMGVFKTPFTIDQCHIEVVVAEIFYVRVKDRCAC